MLIWLPLILVLLCLAASSHAATLRRRAQEDTDGELETTTTLPDWPYAFFVTRANLFQNWCIDARDGVSNGADLGLLPCDFTNAPDDQLFLLDGEGKIHSKVDPNKCFAVDKDTVQGGARIKFLDCNAPVTHNTFMHNKTIDLISVKEDSTFCLKQTGNDPDRTDTIRTEPCDSSISSFVYLYNDADCSTTDYADVDCCDDNDCPQGETCQTYECKIFVARINPPDIPAWPFA